MSTVGNPVPREVADLVWQQRWATLESRIRHLIQNGQYTRARSVLDRFINEYEASERGVP